MVEPNRHKRRRVLALRRQDHTDEEIDRLLDAVGGDPVLDARRTRQYVGDISDMTLWRWQEDPELAFPAARSCHRQSTILATQCH